MNYITGYINLLEFLVAMILLLGFCLDKTTTAAHFATKMVNKLIRKLFVEGKYINFHHHNWDFLRTKFFGLRHLPRKLEYFISIFFLSKTFRNTKNTITWFRGHGLGERQI